MRLVAALAWCAAVGAIAFLVWETKRLAELAGRHGVAAREAREALAAAAVRALVTPPAPAAPAAATNGPSAEGMDPVEYARMALDLKTTQDRLAAVEALLEQRNLEAKQRAEAAAAANERANQPVPQGVRDCLVALHDCLRAEGYFGPRFLRAGAVGPDGLCDVEMLDGDSAGIDVAVVTARRVTATLDRGRGRLELRFFDGHRTLHGQRTQLAKDGWPLVFDDVDGRRIEARMPYWVRAEGVYPALPGAGATTDVDASLRRQWLARFDRLLAAQRTAPKWRVTRFRGLEQGWFLGAELVGTDEKGHVVAGAHCARLAVETDAATGLVSLRLLDGVLRRGTLESRITGEGTRLTITDLTIQQANETMLGLCVPK